MASTGLDTLSMANELEEAGFSRAQVHAGIFLRQIELQEGNFNAFKQQQKVAAQGQGIKLEEKLYRDLATKADVTAVIQEANMICPNGWSPIF